jgi:hypothetical protein
LEVYSINFLYFVYGSPTNIEALGQDEETKTRPNKTAQEEEVQTQEPQDLKGGGHEKKEPQTIQKQEQVETILATKVEISKIQPLEIELQIKSTVNEVKIVELEVGTKPLVVIQVGTTNIIVEKLDV